MNKGKRWSTEENDLIISKLIDNISIDKISEDIERSRYAVIKQLEKILLNNNINITQIYENLLIKTIIESNGNLNLSNDLKPTEIITGLASNDKLLIESNIKNLLNDIIYEIEDTIDLNKEQKECYKEATYGHNLLITGPGGVGKSTVLKKIISYLNRKNKKIGVTSSTGISATLIGGTTVHSFLKIGIGRKSASELYEQIKLKHNKTFYNKIKKLEVLIIDEISMIDDQLFNKIAGYISLIKEIKKPFGEIQIILCGDFYQLPPIENNFCFTSNIWNRLKIKTIILKQKMRQIDDVEFQKILDEVKLNKISKESFTKLNNLIKTKEEINEISKGEIKPTIIYSKNINVDNINKREFENLINVTNNKVFDFPITYNKSVSKINKFISNNESLYPETIQLCKGAQIMVTHNIDVKSKITNGTRGVIEEIRYPFIKIKTLDDTLYDINYVSYQNDLHPDIQFEYIPLKLAWAITIHKCVHENTLIYTQNGLKRINKISKDIYNDSHKSQTTKDLSLIVMGKLGYAESTQIYKGSIIETLKVRTSLGFSLEGSYKHPILTYNDKNEEEWKKLSDIKINDYIVMKYNTQCFGNYISTEKFVKNYIIVNKSTKYTIPMYVNEKLAYLIGALIGDGSYSIKNDYPIDFCGHKDANIKDIYIDYFNELFNVDIKIANCSKDKAIFRIIKCSKHICEFLLWCGLKYETAGSKTIPWVILENTRECHISCLKGLFDTDGGVNNDSVHYTTISEQLAIDIQNLLLNLGIISSVNKLTNNDQKKHSQAYRLLITGYQAHLFYKNIGFNEIRKQEKLKIKYGEYKNKIKSNILEIPNGKQLINDFRDEIYLYYKVKKCNYIPTKLSKFMSRVISNKSKLRLYDLKFINDSFDNISKFGKNGTKIKYIYENNLIFQKIVEINNSKNQVYDLYVPGDHSFIGNGVVNHNSQGQTLDYVQMSLGNDIFEFGMAYVALSRAKEMKSIILTELSINAFKTHHDVIEFYNNN